MVNYNFLFDIFEFNLFKVIELHFVVTERNVRRISLRRYIIYSTKNFTLLTSRKILKATVRIHKLLIILA